MNTLKAETQVKRVLKRLKLPRIVADVRFELDEDWSGDDCVRVIVVLRNDLSEKTWSQGILRPIREAIRKAVHRVNEDWLVYTGFREKREQDDLDARGYRI